MGVGRVGRMRESRSEGVGIKVHVCVEGDYIAW